MSFQAGRKFRRIVLEEPDHGETEKKDIKSRFYENTSNTSAVSSVLCAGFGSL